MSVAQAKAEKLDRENRQALGDLVERESVEARHRAAATEMRRGVEAMRRDLLAAVPVEAADLVGAAYDAGAERLRERVARALAGDGR